MSSRMKARSPSSSASKRSKSPKSGGGRKGDDNTGALQKALDYVAVTLRGKVERKVEGVSAETTKIRVFDPQYHIWDTAVRPNANLGQLPSGTVVNTKSTNCKRAR